MTQPSQHIEKKCCPSCRSGYTGSPLPDLCANCRCHSPIEKNWEARWDKKFDNVYRRDLFQGQEAYTTIQEDIKAFIRREKQLSYQAGKDAVAQEVMEKEIECPECYSFFSARAAFVKHPARSQENKEI